MTPVIHRCRTRRVRPLLVALAALSALLATVAQPVHVREVDAAVQFTTLPVGATLPSEADCASRVRPTPELATRGAVNATYNARKGTGGNYLYPRVTGNFTGTTDEIIQWAACKWGMDEDLLRAQTVQESSWFQNAMGDFTSTASSCTPVLPVANYPSQYPGDPAHNGQCPESVGLLQVRWLYHRSAFFSSTTETTATMTNNAVWSTAYNVDYYGAFWRDCFEGRMTWLNTVERGATYAAGDATGCQGVWFAGRWRTSAALGYIAAVQTNLANRVWESAAFASQTSPNSVKSPTPVTLDTVAPTTSITSPARNATLRGTVTLAASASDDVGVTRVDFLVDGVVRASDTTSPYSTSWSSRTVRNGTHTVQSRAYDAAGHATTSASVSVRVSN